MELSLYDRRGQGAGIASPWVLSTNHPACRGGAPTLYNVNFPGVGYGPDDELPLPDAARELFQGWTGAELVQTWASRNPLHPEEVSLVLAYLCGAEPEPRPDPPPLLRPTLMDEALKVIFLPVLPAALLVGLLVVLLGGTSWGRLMQLAKRDVPFIGRED
jgi:hypothetical protein